MNLNYEKIKSRIEHGGNAWTSYSDLFLVLSVVFLLLYLVSTLRTSTAAFVTSQAYRKATEENEVLRKQLSAYEVLKEDYLQKGATAEQLGTYQQMVKRLDLLSEDTHSDRKRLEQESRELNEKERALNQYQLMMKSMINASLVAQGRMHQRDLTIEQKEQRIEEKDRNISALNQALGDKQTEIAHKEQEISDNKDKIAKIQDSLAQSIREVNYAYRSKKKSQEAMHQEVARLKADSEHQVAALQGKISEEAKRLKSTQDVLEDKNRELERTITSLQDKERDYGEAVAKAQSEREARQAAVKAQREEFDRTLAAERLSADEKSKRQKAYLAKIERERTANDEKLQKAEADLAGTQKNLSTLQSSYQKSLSSLARSNDTLKQDLNDTMARKNERRRVAKRIAAGLAKAGIHAVVDPESGDVTVHFQEEYFDYGHASLKPKMRAELDKFFPAYSAALFGEDTASRIANVDIMGFASPTFRGKFVDPASLGENDRAAVNFNMDLSYQRAKAIFTYVFETKLNFPHQKDMLPLVRVTGRSYLAERRQGAGRAPASSQDYCVAYDCQKSQRVIIKFNLKEE